MKKSTCIFFLFSVSKLAAEKIAPLVKKMDEEQKIDDSIRQMLFENGVCIFKFKF